MNAMLDFELIAHDRGNRGTDHLWSHAILLNFGASSREEDEAIRNVNKAKHFLPYVKIRLICCNARAFVDIRASKLNLKRYDAVYIGSKLLTYFIR